MTLRYRGLPYPTSIDPTPASLADVRYRGRLTTDVPVRTIVSPAQIHFFGRTAAVAMA